MRYPKFLDKNGTIGFVSPSFGCAIEPYKTAFASALKKFEDLGYKTSIGPNAYKCDGIGISTNPADCGKEFMDYYLSKDNDSLISCGGGELMCETIDCIDFDKIKEADPKWFMGYSDNTNLTFLLATLCDVAAIYGPCAATFGMEPWHSAIKDALDVLTGATTVVSSYDKWERESIKDETNPLVPYNVTEANVMKVFPEGNVNMQGRLLGGCLDCLSNLAGTKYDKVAEFNEKYKEEGVIWFIESCDLSVMDMRRVMWKLDRAGWFKYTKGFIIGRPLRYGEEFMGLDQYSAVLGVIEKYNVPIIMDADIGHLPPMMPLVTGSLATVAYENNNLRINMEYK